MTKNLGLESSKSDSSFKHDEGYFANWIQYLKQTRHTESAESSKRHFCFYSNDVRVETQLIYCDTKKTSQILQDFSRNLWHWLNQWLNNAVAVPLHAVSSCIDLWMTCQKTLLPSRLSTWWVCTSSAYPGAICFMFFFFFSELQIDC